MSLLDDPPETLRVYPGVEVADAYGNTSMVAGTVAVTVAGHVQPLVGSEDARLGQAADERYSVYARQAPLSAWAEVEWDERRFDVVDQPRRYVWPGHMSYVVATIQGR